jgi:hypothetical protein
LNIAVGYIKNWPYVVIPTVPKTVNVAPILIPASTYRSPISSPLKKLTLLSFIATVATPLKSERNKACKSYEKVSFRNLFSHNRISNELEKSTLSKFLIRTCALPSFKQIAFYNFSRQFPLRTSLSLM